MNPLRPARRLDPFRLLPWLAPALLLRTLAANPAPVVFDSFTYTGRDAAGEIPLPPGHYRNPILSGFHPDPSVCRVGDDFYLVNSTFAYFPGIPVYHSRDLVHWTHLGDVIGRPNQLNYDGLGVSRGIFAPAISHHDGTFYLVCTMVDSGGNFLVTARDPAGPWSDPVWLGFEGIDPSLFFDSDGRAWLVNNGAPDGTPLYPGHRAIWLQEFEPATRRLIGPRRVIVNGGTDLAKKPVWIEGPHLYRRGDWYYLCCAEGGTESNHSEVVFRSRSVTGPFAPWDRNPILTQRDLDGTAPLAVTSTGHADLVIGPDGHWWSVFLGCQPFAGKFYATGRETFLLPVRWTDDGWPQILAPGERVPLIVRSPVVPSEDSKTAGLSAFAPATPDLTGNFTARTDFASQPPDPNSQTRDPSSQTPDPKTQTPGPTWLTLRAPQERWWTIDHGLRLSPRADNLAGKGSPAFLARRLQHARFEVSTTLEVPAAAGVSAGLVIFQNETHHYYFGVKRTAAGLVAFVEKWNGPTPEVAASSPLPESAAVTLRLTGEDRDLAFAWSVRPDDWKVLLAGADATVVTTEAAGGFVGAMVGLHARLEP